MRRHLIVARIGAGDKNGVRAAKEEVSPELPLLGRERLDYRHRPGVELFEGTGPSAE